MKKLTLTTAIVLGLGLTTFADPNGGGLFNRGEDTEMGGNRTGGIPMLPYHGQQTNQNADTPLDGGITLLLGMGVAYLMAKNNDSRNTINSKKTFQL